MNQFLANSFSKLMGIFAGLLLAFTIISGVITLFHSFLYGVGIIVLGTISIILVFGSLAVILSQYEEVKAIKALLQYIQSGSL